MADESQETEDIILCYVGSRLNVKGQPLDLWVVVTSEQFEEGVLPSEDERHDAYRVYGKSTRKHLTGNPGAVYKVPQVKGGTTIYPSEARWQGLWPDQERRFRWQVEHREATTTIDLRKQAKKEGSEDNFAALKPIRERYGKLISQDRRAALLAQILAYITRG